MKRFAFRVSDEDRAHIAQLELAGTHITVDIDPVQGGIFAVHEDASLTWTWVEDIDFSGGADDGDDEEEDLTSSTDVGEAVSLAIAAAGAQAPPTARMPDEGLGIEVSEDDFESLSALQACGYQIFLSLEPHTGGLEAVHTSGACLKWYFITDLNLEPEPDVEDDLRTDDLAAMVKAFRAAIGA